MVPIDIPAGSGRRLAALYHPPSGADRGRGVLILNPLGQEAVRAHRLLRVLADRLARMGVHVLRFDFHGCGDSSGDDLDGEMKGWQLDALAAHQCLRQKAGTDAIGWLGIRLGFAVGWQAALRFGGHDGAPDTGALTGEATVPESQATGGQTTDRPVSGAGRSPRSRDTRLDMLTEGAPPDRLIGWDPVVQGQAYLDTLWQDHQAALRLAFSLPTVPDAQLKRQQAEADLSEAMGFALSPRLVRHIRRLDRQDWSTLPVQHVAVLQANGALPWPEDRRPAGLTLVPVDVDFDWTSEEALNTPLVPDAALKRLLPWLSEGEFHG
jgi:hypothetical protein